MESTLGQVEC